MRVLDVRNKATSITLVMLFILTALGCSDLFAIRLISPSPPVLSSRQIVSQTLALHEKWRVKSGNVGAAFSGHAWQWTEQGLVYANSKGQLVLLNSRDGQRLWQVEYDEFGRMANSLVADEERVYLVSDWQIKAYALATGQFLWQSDKLTAHRAYFLVIDHGTLLVYERPASDKNLIYKFDPENGAKLDTETLPEQNPPVMFLMDNIYLGKAAGRLWAVETTTNKVLWSVSSGTGHIRVPPVMINDLLVVADWGDVLVLKLSTGELLWQKLAYTLSNVAVLNKTVYVVTEDASIRAHDLITGQEQGVLQMAPPTTMPNNHTYALTVNPKDQILYTYYGDSEEIIAFAK